jgi:hypothetical protein
MQYRGEAALRLYGEFGSFTVIRLQKHFQARQRLQDCRWIAIAAQRRLGFFC